MKVIVNGEEREVFGEGTLGSLLEAIGAGERRVAVMINQRVAPWDDRARVSLRDGDRVEVFRLVGGG